MKKYFLIFIIVYSISTIQHHIITTQHTFIRTTIQRDFISYVDVFYGTGTTNEHQQSTGNLYPISARPFGTNHWTVTTNGQSPWLFDRTSKMFYAIRCTHQPSVWLGDHSFFDIKVDSGVVRFLEYDITPSKLGVKFTDSEITLVPTETGAILNFKGPLNLQLGRLEYKFVDENTIVGTAKTHTIRVPPSHTVLHVVIKIRANQWRVGTSFIGEKEAYENIPTETSESLLKENNKIWNQALGKIVVEDFDIEALRKFYSILYRTLLYPRSLKEPSGRHYSPYSKGGGVFEGELSTASGFWDAYRTVYPLLHLVYPEYASKILDGWVNSIRESPDNLLAQWASPASLESMEGTLGEISIAEGIMNDAISDIDTAWNYLYKSSMTSAGRAHYDVYSMLGYVPNEVSLSLSYYLTDYVVSLAANKLGYTSLSEKLLYRSGQWKLLFDRNDTKFFRPIIDGDFSREFDEFTWMGPYREGGPWQYRFYVPHDPETLNSWGYENQMCVYLSKMMNHKHKPHVYKPMIHEESELYSHMFGQYAHNNQPVHHIPYLFQHVGCGIQGQKLIKYILDNSYTTTGYPGDEDNGEMSAWYILSSLGLYSLVPGSLKYQIGSTPQFKYVNIDNGRIIIENRNKNTTWETVTINDKEFCSELVYLQYNKSKHYKISF